MSLFNLTKLLLYICSILNVLWNNHIHVWKISAQQSAAMFSSLDCTLYPSHSQSDNIIVFTWVMHWRQPPHKPAPIRCSDTKWLLRLLTGCNILTLDNASLQKCSRVWWNALDFLLCGVLLVVNSWCMMSPDCVWVNELINLSGRPYQSEGVGQQPE